MTEAITTSQFDTEVLGSETPVIVDFWAEWCGPCRAVSPILEQIAEERADELRVVKVNIDEEPELQQRYGILSIPTILLFKGGEPAAAAIGAQPKRMLERSLGLSQRPSGSPAGYSRSSRKVSNAAWLRRNVSTASRPSAIQASIQSSRRWSSIECVPSICGDVSAASREACIGRSAYRCWSSGQFWTSRR